MEYYGRADQFKLVDRRTYRGIPCYVLDYRRSVPGRIGPLQRWFIGQSDGLLYGIQRLQLGQPSIEHWWSDYHEVVPGGWFPMKSSWCFYASNWLGQAKLQSMCKVEVTQFHINEPLADELFVLPFKPGIEIQDMRSGKLETYKLSPTLIDKPIGPLEDISLPVPLPVKGKPLLIVFVDFDQRPSRHVLGELVEHLDDPMFKHVTLIVIQATSMPSETLASWREKLELPMQIGVITGDPQAVRWSWAVQSLPWLVLVDEGGRVVAEGFSLEGLDEELNKIGESS